MIVNHDKSGFESLHQSMPYKDPEDKKRWREARKTGKAYIYWLLEPETRKVRYVGSTLDIQERMRLHWDHRNKRTTQLAEWLRSLDEMPEHEVIEEVPQELQYEAEEYWTKMLRQIESVDLLNFLDGKKHAVTGYKRPPEVGEKIRETVRKRKEAGTYPQRLNFKRGEESPSAKLHDEEARAIKHSTESLRVLAARYDVSWITIRNIRIGKTWKHIT
jgi:predicted GIY-YIG superfamily endonuclease